MDLWTLFHGFQVQCVYELNPVACLLVYWLISPAISSCAASRSFLSGCCSFRPFCVVPLALHIVSDRPVHSWQAIAKGVSCVAVACIGIIIW